MAEKYLDLLAAHGPRAPYMVQALLEKPLTLDQEELLAELEGHGTKVLPLDPRSPVPAFVYPDYTTEVQGKRAPMQHVATPAPKLNPQQLEEALGQTWDWAEARATAKRARAALILSDVAATDVPRKTRMQLFHRFVRSVVELAEPLALLWLPSQRLVSPRAYLDAVEAKRPFLSSCVNVRLFRVGGPVEGEMVMDTLGLHAFGLPDLQCHFVKLDALKVASVLFGLAQKAFDDGDVFTDGKQVEGITPEQRWTCQHARSLAEPGRLVVDLNPGAEFKPAPPQQ